MTRLIDADALMKQWEEYLVSAIGNFAITPADITAIIENAPTVEAEFFIEKFGRRCVNDLYADRHDSG